MSQPPTSQPPAHYVLVGEADPELDRRLSDELDRVNRTATAEVAPQRELTVQILDDVDELIGGLSGWTWGHAAGIGLLWVREDARGSGVGSELLAEFEDVARERGCRQIFTTSFTFQAPELYQRHGYVEIGRWDGLPIDGIADVHLRKWLA